MSYLFQNATAFDPYTGQGVPNASGQVFAMSDTAFAAPLTVILLSSGLQTTELVSDQYSQLPGFDAGDNVQVRFRSGEFVKILNTSTPLVGPTGDTGKSAYEVAVEGGYAGTEAEYNATLTDAPNLVARAEIAEAAAVNAANLVGAPADTAIAMAINGPGTQTATALNAAIGDRVATEVPPLARQEAAAFLGEQPAVVDAAAAAVEGYVALNGLSDPRVEATEGDKVFAVQFDGDAEDFLDLRPEPAGSDWAYRLVSPNGSTAFGVRLDGSVYPSPEIPEVDGLTPEDVRHGETSGPNLVRIGDSMSQQWASSYVGQNLPGSTPEQITAAGGETSYEVAARVGAIPVRLLPAGNTIPASGGVDVTTYWTEKIIAAGTSGIDGWLFLQGATTLTGTLAGIPGTLSAIRDAGATQYVHHPGDRYVFTRTTAGSAVTVAQPEAFVVSHTADYRGGIPVINLGTNNLDQPDRIEADVRAIVDYFACANQRFIIWSSFGLRPSDPNYAAAVEVRKRLERVGGANFVDVVAWMSQFGLAYASITPTSQDTTDMADGIVPTSLSASLSDRHYNQTGYGIAGYLIAKKMKERGWFNTNGWVVDPIGAK